MRSWGGGKRFRFKLQKRQRARPSSIHALANIVSKQKKRGRAACPNRKLNEFTACPFPNCAKSTSPATTHSIERIRGDDKLKEALIKSTDYSVPSAVADGHHSSDDISSTCMLITLTRGHPLPRTVLNTHLIRGPEAYRTFVERIEHEAGRNCV